MNRLFKRKKEWQLGWSDPHAVTHSFMGILIIGIVFAVTMSMLLLTGNVTLQEHSWRWEGMINQVFLFLLVAVGEEWLFRGYLYGLYKSMTGVKMAIVLNSCLFAAIHLLNPNSLSKPLEHIILEMVNLFLLSVIMSLAREYSGSLWMPIGIHFAMNFLQSSIFGFLNGGKQVDSLFYFEYVNKTLWNGAGYGLESSMVFTPVLIFSVLLMYFIFSKKDLRFNKSLANKKEMEK